MCQNNKGKIKYKMRTIFLLNEISCSLPGFCVAVNEIDGLYIHLNVVMGLGNPGSKSESRSKGKIKLFFQIDWEEFGGEESREIKQQRWEKKMKEEIEDKWWAIRKKSQVVE